MKKFWIIVVSVCVMVVLLCFVDTPAQAAVVESGTCGDNLTWTLDDEGTLVIEGEGEMTSSPWREYAAYVTNAVIGDGVTKVPMGALAGCGNLESITLPFVGDCATSKSSFGYIFGTDSYTGAMAVGQYDYSNGYRGFEDYYIPLSLKSVTLTGTNLFFGAFEECSMLTSIILSDDITTIGPMTFYMCSGLTSITLPSNLTKIDYSAFLRCSSLGNISFPEGLVSIGNEAFYGCRSFTSITVPDSVTSIGKAAFGGCSSLQSVTLPFVGATPITSAQDRRYPLSYVFGGSGNQFYSAHQHYRDQYGYWTDYFSSIPVGLKSVTITGGYILYGAFENCSSLTSINLPENLDTIGQLAFRNCTGLTSIDIPKSVTTIGGYAFEGCTGLTTVDLPAGLTSINEFLFSECKGLTHITIPDGVTAIDNYAFRYCTALKGVIIPESVETIEAGVFGYCDSVPHIYYLSTEEQKSQIDMSSTYSDKFVWHSGCKVAVVDNQTVVYCPECNQHTLPDGSPYSSGGYYLVGYINGADYGCESDYENLGEYLFMDGKLVATFAEDSYVFIKTGDNRKWFMASDYTTDTSVTLSDSNNGAQEKLFVPGGAALVFTLEENEDGSLTLSYELVYTVHGTVSGFGDDSDAVTVELVADGTVIQSSNSASFSFPNVASGSYVLRFSKKNHVTREYSINVRSRDYALDAMLRLIGDIDGDGKVNMKDWNLLYDHINEKTTLTGYALQCANVTGDSKLNMKDWNRLCDHINEVNPLW